MDISSKFGSRVRTQRKLRGMNQRGLAAATDGVLSQPTLQRIEAGTSQPSLEQIIALSWALGISAEELTEEEPLSERVQFAARGKDGVHVHEATQKLLPYLQLRVTLDSFNG